MQGALVDVRATRLRPAARAARLDARRLASVLRVPEFGDACFDEADEVVHLLFVEDQTRPRGGVEFGEGSRPT